LFVENIPAVTDGVTVIIPSTTLETEFDAFSLILTSYTYLPVCKLEEVLASNSKVIIPAEALIDTLNGIEVCEVYHFLIKELA